MQLNLFAWLFSIVPFGNLKEYPGFYINTRENEYGNGKSFSSIGTGIALADCRDKVMSLIYTVSIGIDGLHWHKEDGDCHYVVQMVSTTVDARYTSIFLRDIDECKDNNGDCGQTCVNTLGSYHCTCEKGYELNQDKKRCDDIDECARKIDGCSDICSNTIGSYQCHCEKTRHLLPNKKTCEDDYYEVKVMMPPQEWLINHFKGKEKKEDL